MNVRLIHITPEAEKHIAYCARVSSPNQNNLDYVKLLKYCIKHKHWSIFEMSNFCVEIVTSRAISAQILRHKSFSFQEFSARYATVQEFETYQPRRQDEKNRQNSIDDLPAETQDWFLNAMIGVNTTAKALYDEALRKGVAKESARMLLPMTSQTKIYMHGNVRSWINYLQVRCGPETQLEHREIALAIKEIFVKELPVVASALEWC